MFYENIRDDSPEHFLRATGVSKPLFEEILTNLEQHKSHMGRPPKLRLSDQLVLTLMYLREYRTLFHIGKTYSISEATTHRIVIKIENILISCGKYVLPSKKSLTDKNTEYELVLLDATETPCERPKKNRKNSIVERKSATL